MPLRIFYKLRTLLRLHTESIYRRYAIVDEAMLREGAEKLSVLHGAERQMRPLNKAAGEK